jgi:hypothetical protein
MVHDLPVAAAHAADNPDTRRGEERCTPRPTVTANQERVLLHMPSHATRVRLYLLAVADQIAVVRGLEQRWQREMRQLVRLLQSPPLAGTDGPAQEIQHGGCERHDHGPSC